MNQLPVFAQLVVRALKNLNVEKAAQFSAINHHVVGLNYLNLHRSDNFTLKLYLIEEQANNESGYLVHPHNHRYEFSTQVLAGRIGNVVFDDVGVRPHKSEQRLYEDDIAGGGDFAADKFKYSSEAGLIGAPEYTWLDIDTGKSAGYGAGGSYYLKTDQIHTLFTWPEPTLLALSQFADIRDKTRIYLPHGQTELPPLTARTPTLDETEAMRLRCLELIEGARYE